jgi:hypothetical protein
MTLTASLAQVSEALFTKFETNKASLGIEAVYYGDQNRLPVTPALCVEPDAKQNTLKSALRVIAIEFKVYILIYHSSVTSPQDNRRAADALAEATETLIHADRTLGGLVTHCMVDEVASGYVTKNNSLMRASRLSFSAISQNQLPG